MKFDASSIALVGLGAIFLLNQKNEVTAEKLISGLGTTTTLTSQTTNWTGLENINASDFPTTQEKLFGDLSLINKYFSDRLGTDNFTFIGFKEKYPGAILDFRKDPLYSAYIYRKGIGYSNLDAQGGTSLTAQISNSISQISTVTPTIPTPLVSNVVTTTQTAQSLISGLGTTTTLIDKKTAFLAKGRSLELWNDSVNWFTNVLSPLAPSTAYANIKGTVIYKYEVI